MFANFIGGKWLEPDNCPTMPVYNPASGEVIDQTPLSSAVEVSQAVAAAARVFPAWAGTALMERTRLMFNYKAALERDFEQLAAIITRNHGKTLDEARGEVRRGIEMVDFACGAPTLLQGRTLRGVSAGIDQDYYRYPLGVVGGIVPFNFPVMIPLWMFPLAVVSGNTFVLKPSERTALGAVRLAQLFAEAGFPDGVLNLVHGAGEAVNALLAAPQVRAISFVGSEPVARFVYQEGARHTKRVQAAGGAKNHLFVLPDADLDLAIPAVINSAFGNAGERCLAGSVAVAVGGIAPQLIERLEDAAGRLKLGPGDQPGVDLGPLVADDHRRRVLGHIKRAADEGARVVVDGRRGGCLEQPGFFLGPTILDQVTPAMAAGRDEIFGPVLSVTQVGDVGQAIDLVNQIPLGNMAAVFTGSGRAARQFREQVECGMIGINVGVAQPLAFYPFSGWKSSFYGDLHLQGSEGIEFYTQKKIVVSRW
jgi:malonate-semialdehyde dehydrogenase (acetylating) / methylmalonate-semialdehyde dehydrogenase